MEEVKKPFYKEVAEKLIEQLEKGVAPWQRGWSGIGKPYNVSTGKSYRGANVINLASSGYGDPRWMTYKQAQEVGAQVKKGEKGTKVQYWIFEEMQAVVDKDGNPKLDHNGKEMLERVRLERPKVINSVVFNAEQIDGLPPLQKQQGNIWESIEKAEAILKNSGANIEHKFQEQAYYQPSTDKIVLPTKEQFKSPEVYYGTALHELGHWTGHSSRLDRDLSGSFGSQKYAREELRAEISSMMIEMEMGIPHDTDRHASYVQSWIKVLKEDPAEIIRASSDAEKIKDFVLNLSQKQVLDSKQEQSFEFVVSHSQSEHIMEKTYISVPFKEKEDAKKLGAKWDRKESSWYIPENLDKSIFSRWLDSNINENDISEMLRGKLDDMNEYFSYQAGLNGVTYMSADGRYITAGNIADGVKVTINKGEDNIFTFNFSNGFGENQAEYRRNIDKANINQGVEEFGHSLNDFISLTQKFKADKSLLKEKTEQFFKDKLEQIHIAQSFSETKVNVDKTYLAVPFTEKDEAKALGAKWDKVAKSWYVSGEVPDKLKKWLPENNPIQQDPALTPREEFANFMKDMGLIVSGEHPIMDGKLHRVRTENDKSKDLSGAYILHGDGFPAGYVQNFKTGEKHNWKSKGYHISSDEMAKIRAESAQKLQERENEVSRKHEEVSEKLSQNISNLSKLKADQTYLVKKGIKLHDGVFEDKHRNMVIPAYDENGKIWASQTIYPDGNKRFTAGGRKEGNFHVVGGLEHLDSSDVIIIAEGYATAATIKEASNRPVVAAFDSGNLKTVAEKLHQKYPDKPIIIAGDDDAHRTLENKPNVGRTKAIEAADSVNGVAIFPIFPKEKIGDKSCTDFNDLARESEHKLEAVKHIILSSIDGYKKQQNDKVTQSKTTKIKR
ncbi:TPA: zincin-like metallopeptidase domain-containing protein [Pasteurella multocida]